MPTPSYAPNYIKEKNRGVVYDLFFKHEQLSRAEITRLTTMSFPTVIKIIDFLLSKQIIIETGDTATQDGMGRKSRLLKFNPNSYTSIGVLFEGKFVSVGLINLKGEVLYSETLAVPEVSGADTINAFIGEKIKHFLSGCEDYRILGIGLGLPGNPDPANYENGRFASLFSYIRDQIGLPVYFDNDVNTLAVGEQFLRGNPQQQDLIFISLGSGLGSGIILDGHLRRGNAFRAGEIAAMVLEKPENVDYKNLGASMVQNKVSIAAIKERFGVDIGSNQNVDEGTKQEIIEYISDYLVLVLNNYVYALDVPEIIISGVTPHFLGEDFYLYLNFQIKKIMKTKIQISPSISESTGIVGGGTLVISNMLQSTVLA